MSKLSFIITGATACMLLLPVNAGAQKRLDVPQGVSYAKVLGKERKTNPSILAAEKRVAEEQMPQMFKGMTFRSKDASALRRVSSGQKISPFALSPKIPLRPSESLATGRELWGEVIQDNTWTSGNVYGIYKFNALSNITVEMLGANMAIPNGGGAIIGNRLYYVWYSAYYGQVYPYFFEYDTETWQPISTYEYTGDVSLVAAETALSADRKVYGEFYNSAGNAYELGIADYENRTRSTIGSLNNFYVAMGMTSDNILYGIATDGNLYKIDINTAAETKVGSTGLTVSNSQNAYFYQSGEIDQKTNTFYWATSEASESMDSEVASLYTVDLATGAASKVGDFENQNLIMLMSIPTKVEDGAPAAVTDLTTNFGNGELTGSVTFKAPTTTSAGETLSGELTYTIASGTEILASGTTSAGATVTADVVFKSEGNKMLTVYLSNAEGDGVKTKQAVYVGVDTPKAVSGLTFDLDNATGVATLSWQPVTEGVNGGYIGDVKYTVTRYPDNKVVSTDLTDTQFTETLTKGGIQTISYGVTVSNSKNTSAETVSDGVMFGDGFIPPYTNSFSDNSSFDLLTIIDNNSDGRTWAWYSGPSSDPNGSARYKYSRTGLAGDDWLVTPPLKLEKGKFYAVSFKVRTNSSSYTERFEVKYGKGKTVADMTETLVPATETTSASFVEYKQTIIPTEDETIYIGFHEISDAGNSYVFLDDITVDEGKSYLAPDSVSNFKVVPGALGARKAEISFNAPSKTIDGTSTPGTMTIKLYRGNDAIKTFTGVSAGEALSYVDGDAENGFNSYKVVPISDEYGTGIESSTRTVFVGIDIPGHPQNMQLTDNTSSIHMTWDAPEKGANGGYADPQSIYYNIYNITNESGVNVAELADATEKGVTSYDMAFRTDEGCQQLKQFGVASANEDGKSEILLSPSLIVGAPYTLPFYESIPDKVYTNDLWWVESYGGTSTFTTSSESSDGDGGCFLYTSDNSNEFALLGTGKISMKGAKNPTLSFKHKALASSNAMIYVWAKKPDGSKDFVKFIMYSILGNAGSWIQESIPLNSSYADLDHVILQFECHADAGQTIAFDEFSVRDVYEHDLAINDVTAPLKMKKGDAATVSIKVANEGKNEATGYTVKLYANDELVESQKESETLAAYDSKTYTMQYKSSVMDEGNNVKLKAEVEYDSDLFLDNNSKTATVDFNISDKPRPESVTATETVSGKVTVNWTAPTEYSQTVNDGFETYTPWAMDEFGDWKCVSGNTGAVTGSPLADVYPNYGELFAFTVVDPLADWITEEVLSSYESYKAHGGDRYIASFYKYDGTTYADRSADEWLVSPCLSGKAQTIKFWVSNHNTEDRSYAETYDVLYSTTGSDTCNFVKLGDTHTASSGAWEEVSVEIPAGATYFAIHQNTISANTFMFQIDDVTYEGGSGAVIGYNVYRDGELIKSISGASNIEFVDETAEGGKTYVYAVTALYADGESEASVAAAITTDIENVEIAIKADSYNVYTLDGKAVGYGMKSLKNLKSGSYVINGQKVVIR